MAILLGGRADRGAAADERRAAGGRTAGRTFAISTAGSIAGTFVTAFWLIPEFGVEQLFVLGAPRFRHRGLVGLADGGSRSSPPGARSPSARASTISLGQRHRAAHRHLGRTGRRSSARAATATSTPATRAPSSRAEDLKVVFAEDTRYHRLAVVDDADTRYLRFDNSLQSAMYRTILPDALPLHGSLPPRDRLQPVGAGRPLRRPRRRLVGEADVARLPQLRLHAVELDPVVVDVAYRTSSCRATRGCRSTSATAAVSSPATRSAGT